MQHFLFSLALNAFFADMLELAREQSLKTQNMNLLDQTEVNNKRYKRVCEKLVDTYDNYNVSKYQNIFLNNFLAATEK